MKDDLETRRHERRAASKMTHGAFGGRFDVPHRLALCSLALLALVQPASAADPAGEAVGVTANATASGEVGDRILQARSRIFSGDLIETDQTGIAQLEFLDETRMVVGPGSRLTIDDFVFQSDNTVRRLTVNAARGAFRFITGRSDKAAYTIRTPVATIGVRGTKGDITVHDDGSASFSIYDGAFRICSLQVPRRCAVLEGSCSVIVLDRDFNYDWLQNVYDRTDYMEENFPFAFDERRLRSPFQVASGSCELREGHKPDPNPDPDPEPKVCEDCVK